MKTDAEIVADCNELAIEFYRMHGCQVEEGYKMYEATHPQEVSMWRLAVHAYDYIEATDVESCLDQLLDSEGE